MQAGETQEGTDGAHARAIVNELESGAQPSLEELHVPTHLCSTTQPPNATLLAAELEATYNAQSAHEHAVAGSGLVEPEPRGSPAPQGMFDRRFEKTEDYCSQKSKQSPAAGATRKSLLLVPQSNRQLLLSIKSQATSPQGANQVLSPQIISCQNAIRTNKSVNKQSIRLAAKQQSQQKNGRLPQLIAECSSQGLMNIRMTEQLASPHQSTSRSSLFNTQVLRQQEEPVEEDEVVHEQEHERVFTHSQQGEEPEEVAADLIVVPQRLTGALETRGDEPGGSSHRSADLEHSESEFAMRTAHKLDLCSEGRRETDEEEVSGQEAAFCSFDFARAQAQSIRKATIQQAESLLQKNQLSA